jgi:hypothetical protein
LKLKLSKCTDVLTDTFSLFCTFSQDRIAYSLKMRRIVCSPDKKRRRVALAAALQNFSSQAAKAHKVERDRRARFE